MIHNPDNIEIKKKEIYDGVIEYMLPDGYYFECCGVSYGTCIFGTIELSNYYTVKKRDNGAIDKKL